MKFQNAATHATVLICLAFMKRPVVIAESCTSRRFSYARQDSGNNMLGSRATIRNVNLAISYPAGGTSHIVDNVPTQIDFPLFKK
jgi:hypothetical protein